MLVASELLCSISSQVYSHVTLLTGSLYIWSNSASAFPEPNWLNTSAAVEGSLGHCLSIRYFSLCMWQRWAKEGSAPLLQKKWCSTISNIAGISELHQEGLEKEIGLSAFSFSMADWKKTPTEVCLLKPTGFPWNLLKYAAALLWISVPAKVNKIFCWFCLG